MDMPVPNDIGNSYMLEREYAKLSVHSRKINICTVIVILEEDIFFIAHNMKGL